MTLSIRQAGADDAALVHQFVLALARYERLEAEVTASVADLRRDLGRPHPRIFCDIAEWDGEPAGFALWFYSYSTFQGRHGIWLEDLFVDPAQRGRGIGKALLRRLARRCRDEGLGRLGWWVLDWNADAIAFYQSQGAEMMDDWTVCRVSGAALERLADG